ncbi:MAG: phosphopantetheinyl transferase [Hyphomicrobium sp.]|uniref:4'-phosphopantetheinyl transferase family protein n=1 Tax=Hyphomicrobium sp. TaxID=82 RepID=UPI0039E6C461
MPGGPKSASTAGAAAGRREVVSGLEIFFINLAHASPVLEAEEKRTTRLSADDIARADAMADTDARRFWRASRIATRIALERVGGTSLRRVAFRIERSGRPVIAGEGPHFSISHTGHAALIAIAKSMAIGVDLEERGRKLRMSVDRRQRIAQAAQRLGVHMPLSAEDDGDILTAWVQLEAIAKALGVGIGRLLTEQGVVGGPRSTRANSTAPPLAVRALSIDAEYVGAIAAERLPKVLAVKPFPLTQMDTFLRGEPS